MRRLRPALNPRRMRPRMRGLAGPPSGEPGPGRLAPTRAANTCRKGSPLMIRPDRLTSLARDRGVSLAAAGAARLASALRGRTRPVVLAGAVLALAGAGSASAAT